METPPTPSSPITPEALDTLRTAITQAEKLRQDLQAAVDSGAEDKISDLSNKLLQCLSEAKRIRQKLEGAPERIITAEHTIVWNKKEGEEEKETRETREVTINFEELLESHTQFYIKHGVELPPDFPELMSDIWDRNEEAITQEIKENGFDELLMIPGDLDLPTLHTKMSVGYNATYEGSNFKTGGSFAGVREEKKPRLVLVHNTANLNDAPVFGAPGIQAKDIMEENQLTLTDWLIWQRMFFDGKGEHPDDWNKKSATWLPGSTIPVDPTDPSKGFRVVDANWAPSVGRLVVSASDASDSNPFLGCRLSRSFL